MAGVVQRLVPQSKKDHLPCSKIIWELYFLSISLIPLRSLIAIYNNGVRNAHL